MEFIYRVIKLMGKGKTELFLYPDLSCFHLEDMFTSCIHPEITDSILELFGDPSSHFRIIIATIALGIVLVCSNVTRTNHKRPQMT